ncbi:MAG: hypothetical protein AAB582_02565 [Patescibacteria group bacterium]
MPIFRALGLGVLILVLGWLVPNVLKELEATVIAFLHGARVSADAAAHLAATAESTPASIPLSALPSYPLPSAPLYNP